MFHRPLCFLKSIGIDGFLIFLALAILLAFWTPEIGSTRGRFSLHDMANYGVLVIFFFYGIGMSVGQLWRGLMNWRLHLLVHLSSFVLFPMVVLVAYGLWGTESLRTLWIGVFYVAALPSTVSSSVVMVSIARGNIPAAIFNASISSLLGVVLTPLWMGLFLTAEASNFDLVDSIRGLVTIVVLPVALGMALNPLLGDWMARNRKYLRYFDQSVVILIVYTSFCDSFAAKAFDGFGPVTLIGLSVGMVILFFVVYHIVYFLCRLFHFNREDTITVLFCGSKKSLMHGSAMGQVLFASMGNLGILLLPIMLYHAFQLIIVSVLARRFSRPSSETE